VATSKREDNLLDEIGRLRAEIRQLENTANSAQLALSHVVRRAPGKQLAIPINELLEEDGLLERDWDNLNGVVTYKIPRKERTK
jgi:hypothetical protein